MGISRRGSMFARGSGKDVYCSRYCSISSLRVIIVVLHRFAEDPLIVSDLVYLDDAPKDEDGRPREKETLEMARRAGGVGDAVCRRCGGGADIASWAYQDDGRHSCRMSGIRTDDVGEKDRGHEPVVPFQHSVERAAN